MRRTQMIVIVATLLLTATACRDDGASRPAATSTSVDPQSTEGRPIVLPGRANWSTGYFQAAVYSALLEELGYEVADPALHEYPPGEGYVAMAEGRFDFWPNGWYSQHLRWHEEPLPDGSAVGDHLRVVGNQVPAGALEGLVITKSVAEAHGIESLAQIDATPELVALFDSDDDGLAEVSGCPEDWTCDDIVSEMIEANGWSNLEQVKAGYPGLAAATIDRVRDELPAIQYVWSPSGYLTDLVPGESVLWLSVGEHDNVLDGTSPGGYDFSEAEPAALGEKCTADPCWIGWEVADIQVTVNADFATANPLAIALFEVVEFSVTDIASENVLYDGGENSEADVARHAAEWIADHRPIVDEWLSAARESDSER